MNINDDAVRLLVGFIIRRIAGICAQRKIAKVTRLLLFAVLKLKPVTFRYRKERDPEGTPQFGLVTEEVEKVNPTLVVPDANGKVQHRAYAAVDATLLKRVSQRTPQRAGAGSDHRQLIRCYKTGNSIAHLSFQKPRRVNRHHAHPSWTSLLAANFT